jgi:hypothetical protein
MAKHYFILKYGVDLEQIQREIINWFKNRQYEVEFKKFDRQYFIQAKKTNPLRTLLGANLAFKVSAYASPHPSNDREIIIETSIGKWVSNIAGAGFASLFMGGIPIFTGIANAGWALILEKELMWHLETTLALTPVATSADGSPASSSSTAPDLKMPQETVIDVTAKSISTARDKAEAAVAEDLKKLQQALSVGIIDRVTFNKKRDKLEEKIDRYEAEFLIEERLDKLQNAFSDGVLDTLEYEKKIQEIHDLVETEIINKRTLKRKNERRKKLKEALENGILTEAEYLQKLEELNEP